jgi:hypothetical protein
MVSSRIGRRSSPGYHVNWWPGDHAAIVLVGLAPTSASRSGLRTDLRARRRNRAPYRQLPENQLVSIDDQLQLGAKAQTRPAAHQRSPNRMWPGCVAHSGQHGLVIPTTDTATGSASAEHASRGQRTCSRDAFRVSPRGIPATPLLTYSSAPAHSQHHHTLRDASWLGRQRIYQWIWYRRIIGSLHLSR